MQGTRTSSPHAEIHHHRLELQRNRVLRPAHTQIKGAGPAASSQGYHRRVWPIQGT